MITSVVSESTTTWAKADGTTTVQAYTGPIRVKYTVDSSGQAYAKGILSGGGGGGSDNSGGYFDPCWLYFTDIGPADSAFPGTVARY